MKVVVRDIAHAKERKIHNNRLSIAEAARLMGASEQFIRIGLQQGDFPFGYAVKMSSRYTYYINRAKFSEYTGIKLEGVSA